MDALDESKILPNNPIYSLIAPAWSCLCTTVLCKINESEIRQISSFVLAKIRWNFARMKIRIGEISRVGIFFVNWSDDGWGVIRPFVLIVTRYCKSSQQGYRAVSGLTKYIEVFTPVILPSLPGHQPRPDHEQNLFRQVLPLFVFSLISFFLIPQMLVLILGHSFICRLHDFLRRNLNTPIAKH